MKKKTFMKNKYELILLLFVIFLMLLSLPLLKSKKIIINLPTNYSSITNAIKNNKLKDSKITHNSKKFFRKNKQANTSKTDPDPSDPDWFQNN